MPRILLRNDSTDLEIVHAIQDQIKIETVSRRVPQLAPRLNTDLLGDDQLDTESISQLLTIVVRVGDYKLPEDRSDTPTVAAQFNLAGLSRGTYTKPRGVNYTTANKLINDALLESANYIEHFNNDWFDFPAKFSGDFHRNYVIRSIITFTGYLQLAHKEALYPEWTDSGTRSLSLTSDESYVLTFPSGKPPVKGFWSLTEYNSSSYLIPNPLERYSLRDQSNLTYPNGKPVYDTDSPNGAFSILIQPGDVPPPANWTHNWLPAPIGGGNFLLRVSPTPTCQAVIV